MLEDLNKYESLELDKEQYAMVPIQMNLTFEDSEFNELKRLSKEDKETYCEKEELIKQDFNEKDFFMERHKEMEELLNEEEDLRINGEFNYNINMDEDFFRSCEDIVPNFGVPLFIEERYLEEEEHINLRDENVGRVNEIDKIFNNIERNHPGVIRRLIRYGVPYNEAMIIVKRIIELTLMYS